MHKELEEAIKFIISENKQKQRFVNEAELNNRFTKFCQNLQKQIDNNEILLNYIDNSISKEVIEEKIKYKKSKLKQIENDRYREMCLQIEIDILEELLEGK